MTKSNQAETALGVVLLAAGASTRMGRPKMLLPWGATSVIGHLIEQWQTLSAAQIAVVSAAGDQAIHAELDRVGFPAEARIANPSPGLGMFGSIRCAARWRQWKPNLTHWAVVLGDQPHLRSETLRALIEFVGAHPANICQPTYQGRRRHPVVLPAHSFRQLPECPETDLKQFLLGYAHEIELCPLDDPGLDLDMDRPEDYTLALGLVSRRREGSSPKHARPAAATHKP